MIISGKFIALSKHDKDFDDSIRDLDRDIPEVLWFNIDNIIGLFGFGTTADDSENILLLTENLQFYLSTSASNKLIEYMRKERDDKVHAWMDNLTDEEREKVKKYMKNLVKEKKCSEE